jgi:hypothetical protein
LSEREFCQRKEGERWKRGGGEKLYTQSNIYLQIAERKSQRELQGDGRGITIYTQREA